MLLDRFKDFILPDIWQLDAPAYNTLDYYEWVTLSKRPTIVFVVHEMSSGQGS